VPGSAFWSPTPINQLLTIIIIIIIITTTIGPN